MQHLQFRGRQEFSTLYLNRLCHRMGTLGDVWFLNYWMNSKCEAPMEPTHATQLRWLHAT